MQYSDPNISRMKKKHFQVNPRAIATKTFIYYQ